MGNKTSRTQETPKADWIDYQHIGQVKHDNIQLKLNVKSMFVISFSDPVTWNGNKLRIFYEPPGNTKDSQTRSVGIHWMEMSSESLTPMYMWFEVRVGDVWIGCHSWNEVSANALYRLPCPNRNPVNDDGAVHINVHLSPIVPLSSLETSVAKMLGDTFLSDCTIKCDDGDIQHLHRFVLASQSSFFRAMFASSMKEAKSNDLIVSDVPTHVMLQVVRFMYCATFEIPDGQDRLGFLQQMWVAADRFNMDLLVNKCQVRLTQMVDTETFLPSFAFAVKYNVVPIADTCIRLFKTIDNDDQKDELLAQLDEIKDVELKSAMSSALIRGRIQTSRKRKISQDDNQVKRQRTNETSLDGS